MFAEFSYDILSGATPNDEVLDRILEKFDVKPDGDVRRRCHLLSGTFICEISSLDDFESVERRVRRLRSDLAGQFHYAFSLRPRNAPIHVLSDHNAALARQIVEA
jgi:hypothetical protein